MKPYYEDAAVTVHHGDCLEVITTLPDSSVDAVVTDPPYGLEFMGKDWDAFGRDTRQPFRGEIQTPDNPYGRSTVRYGGASSYGGKHTEAMRAFGEWCELWSAECLRVLKPGGHMLAFGGTRTWHRLAVAVEDTGFEMRDSIAWLYGSGFPKSLDVSKAIDKAAGAEREVVGRYQPPNGQTWNLANDTARTEIGTVGHSSRSASLDVTAPATEDAQQWSGWGTALKPAFEPIIVARKPLSGTVAANVLQHGTGALNIDGCRIDSGGDKLGGGRVSSRSDGWDRPWKSDPQAIAAAQDRGREAVAKAESLGRWPANVILDESQAAALDGQSGTLTGGKAGANGHIRNKPDRDQGIYGGGKGLWTEHGPAGELYGDSGGASRFFYTAKADQSERITHNGIAHPTVKPLDLMRWLVRLVTPPGGTILEPFAGSGTTVEAAILEGFRCIAIEREADYLPLITQRIHRRRDPVKYLTEAGDDLGLFGEAS